MCSPFLFGFSNHSNPPLEIFLESFSRFLFPMWILWTCGSRTRLCPFSWRVWELDLPHSEFLGDLFWKGNWKGKRTPHTASHFIFLTLTIGSVWNVMNVRICSPCFSTVMSEHCRPLLNSESMRRARRWQFVAENVCLYRLNSER